MTNANSYTVYDNKTDELVILDGTSTECAKAMGVTINTFYSYLCKSKKGIIRWYIEATKPMINSERPKRIKKVRKLRSKGATSCDIAERFGVTMNTVYADLRKCGVSDYGNKTKAIIEEYQSNPNQRQCDIIKKLGFSQPLVNITINKYCKKG